MQLDRRGHTVDSIKIEWTFPYEWYGAQVAVCRTIRSNFQLDSSLEVRKIYQIGVQHVYRMRRIDGDPSTKYSGGPCSLNYGYLLSFFRAITSEKDRILIGRHYSIPALQSLTGCRATIMLTQLSESPAYFHFIYQYKPHQQSIPKLFQIRTGDARWSATRYGETRWHQ